VAFSPGERERANERARERERERERGREGEKYLNEEIYGVRASIWIDYAEC